ncbi:hypothetical protein BATDEDRAFT_88791 [Batrachochytrium dendrobatidis JAM81]|uniref:Uncharacterized protein n=1 Tax=Batrachochytrium dendrobatidis (strain JAM81 / FGSC 10211) TaxID=684364 RepID=F4P360_BATDJ|nr:uncharacterized protein BATDEDRAFT_88791 [Batrachochytrium dendrobatidis JAM81]EGF80426.1 hypothetical protein BATDEDRAFT_88791 [Batrachochytrium dendrobatidis JAM81]KAJ8326495.1 hypothetical protein O5D80_005242 [Batrachochytrium dendrobatidis]KAK5666715.1 hypothetical protein QVD99_006778 [Batrachochytrium dendrobatidis]|eukprot:XP_006679281.1 hypothetical protein BATDEDRAFT_88791 [Batrachochytrium dendrobatidis JAM81]
MGSDSQPQQITWMQWLRSSTSEPSNQLPSTSHESSSVNVNPLSNIPVPEPISDDAWKNPWYPLKEAPKTPEERKLLWDYISNQSNEAQAAIKSSTSASKKQLENAASANCADLAFEYKSCAYRAWIGTTCFKENERLMKCMDIQQRNLEKLGLLSRASMTIEQRNNILDAADYLYLSEVQEELKTKESKGVFGVL